MKTILVFKTSISKKNELKIVRPILNNLINKDDYWNFDLEDCDNILRVETHKLKSNVISSVLNKHGFLCEELH
jgi:hypothetical protein